MNVNRADIMAVLETIPDPEMPISIVDLGIVEAVEIDNGEVRVTVLPTFVGCPALGMIEQDIRTRVSESPGVKRVEVRFVHDPPWSSDRISDAGRASLKAHGVTVPDRGHCAEQASPSAVQLNVNLVACPFCSSKDTTLESVFGPTRCRMMYYCNACRNTFEHIKRL